MSIAVPDRNGITGNVALGFPSPFDYLSDSCYLGATIGHIANRVSGAGYSLGGTVFRQDANEGANSNHGGRYGIDKALFRARTYGNSRVVFILDTPDGFGGHPGNVHIEVGYTLSDDNELRIVFFATTDKLTALNLTNHAYFNLSGGLHPATLDLLQINAGTMVETDGAYIPTGRTVGVGGTRCDFRRPKAICADAASPAECGFNHYYISNLSAGESAAARLSCESTGRTLEVVTSYPGILFYSGDFLQSEIPGIEGRIYGPCDGVCLEAQLFPDAVNRPEFPSIALEPGCEYRHFITYRFGTL